ncbi:protein sprint-like isoform X2 [Amphibalanus amphitrite]|uniref:protein sprint-like isoform X2 n=1 Tax=Amphibalanus amphitrite TaxID=1232801 RepID=UPI001C8FDB3B|nr:protein sprint-like isoform X2 [Amphibalanus amphitrite]
MFSPQTELLNSLARDLDHMLNDLSLDPDSEPPPPTKHYPVTRSATCPVTRMAACDSDPISTSPDLGTEHKRPTQLSFSRHQEDSAVSSCSEPEYGRPAQMSVSERLIRCHPVWFISGLHRSGADHLLHDKPAGTFIVRQSSPGKEQLMTLSVRMPAGSAPPVDHFPIRSAAGKLGLETSEKRFDSISSLIAHYTSHRDELPVQLQLPASLQRVKSRHQLSSLALLGQEFWTCRLPSESRSTGSGGGGRTDARDSAGGANSIGSSPASSLNKPAGRGGSHSSLESPAEPAVLLTLAPLSADERPRPPGSLSLGPDAGSLTRLVSPELVSRVSSPSATTGRAAPRPPARWCQPQSAAPPTEPADAAGNVVSTATFQVSSTASGTVRSEMSVFIGGAAPAAGQLGQTEKETLPQETKADPTSPGSSPGDEVAPLAGGLRAGRRRGRKKRTSEPLESPAAYCRSSVADKISDYEDIWASPARETPPVGSPFSASAAVSRASRETAAALMEMAREAASPSPLYAVPADALRAQPDLVAGVGRRAPADRASHRHSEPALCGWEPGVPAARRPTLPTICAGQEVHHAASADQLSPPPRAVRPSARSQSSRAVGEQVRQRRARAEQWRLDSSWEYLREDDCDADSEWDEEPAERPERPATRLTESTEPIPDPTADISPEEQTRIVHAIIRQSLPMAVPPAASVSASDYDNIRPSARGQAGRGHAVRPTCPVDMGADTDAETDTSKLQSIMRLMNDQLRLKSGQFDADERLFTDSESFVAVHGTERPEELEREVESPGRPLPPRLPLPRSQQESLYSPPRLNSLRLHRKSQQSGAAIRDYVIKLANDDDSTFALCIFNFLKCTREGAETDPHVVMRNIRQFCNGMKNYLVKHGEGEFHQVVHQERSKLSSTEFLNLDAILEGVLEELLVRPLHDHISALWRRTAQRSGDSQRLTENFELARRRPTETLGLKRDQTPPSAAVLGSVRHFLGRMQDSASPLDKLESLLATVSALFSAAGERDACIPADDFLPLLLYALVHCHVTNVEFEADYMWGLLHPMLLNGEAGYYLTMLSSAVHVLKNVLQHPGDKANDSTTRLSQRSGSGSGCEPVEGFLRVVIPDEQQGTILSRTLPCRPGATARDLCRMLDHKLRITSPQDYGLFKLINGDETLVGDLECPQLVKQELASKGVHCMFSYKRLEAKIAWPTGQL